MLPLAVLEIEPTTFWSHSHIFNVFLFFKGPISHICTFCPLKWFKSYNFIIYLVPFNELPPTFSLSYDPLKGPCPKFLPIVERTGTFFLFYFFIAHGHFYCLMTAYAVLKLCGANDTVLKHNNIFVIIYLLIIY